MSQKFTTGVRFNHGFGVMETISFVGEGIGAALFITAFITGQFASTVLGILFVVSAAVALRSHLGQPSRSLRAFTRLKTAWVSRGTMVIAGFLASSIGSVVCGFVPPLGVLKPFATTIALVFAVPVIVYAGMLLRSMRAIRFWRGATVPVAFSAHSLASALTVLWALALLSGNDVAALGWVLTAARGSLVAAAAATAAHLMMTEDSDGTRASVARLTHGNLKAEFFGGAGVIGLALPFACLVLAGTSPAACLLAALARVYGDFAYRHSIIVAGAYEPILPTTSNRAVPRATANYP